MHASPNAVTLFAVMTVMTVCQSTKAAAALTQQQAAGRHQDIRALAAAAIAASCQLVLLLRLQMQCYVTFWIESCCCLLNCDVVIKQGME